MSDEEKPSEGQVLRHDIKNQLSNIILSVEQLKYEIPEQSEDCSFYLEAISKSCKNINEILNKA
jgi:uncharacterized protein YicC (UPF0701 family)